MGCENVLSAYAETLEQQGRALQRILLANRDDDDPANDIVLSRWPSSDLDFLRGQAGEFLNDRARDSAYPEVDRGGTRFDGWTDEATGAPWTQLLQ